MEFMPPCRQGPLKRVKPITNEEEDELIQLFKDIIQHGIELENAKIRLIQYQDFNMLDAF